MLSVFCGSSPILHNCPYQFLACCLRRRTGSTKKRRLPHIKAYVHANKKKARRGIGDGLSPFERLSAEVAMRGLSQLLRISQQLAVPPWLAACLVHPAGRDGEPGRTPPRRIPPGREAVGVDFDCVQGKDHGGRELPCMDEHARG